MRRRLKLPVDQVTPGMFVDELDRPWTETPYMFQGFALENQQMLDELRHLCRHVYVLVDEQDRPIIGPHHGDSLPATPESGAANRILIKTPDARRWDLDLATLEQELAPATEIEHETRSVVYSILDDVRLGKSVDTASAKQVVAGMVESIIRNPDAMVVLSQLKNVDEYTALHSVRVCILAITFGRHLELSREELNLLGLGALLHDVGKMKVPLEILNKPGRLTEAEFEIMKSHVPLGMEVLLDQRGIPLPALQVVERHHERYGGKGYARGLAGDAIGAFGMIGAIVDCYDAITSDRCYHQGMSAHEALTRMYEWRTRDFHPDLVEQFIQCMGVYPIGCIVELSDGTVGVVCTVNRQRRLKPRVVLVLKSDKTRYETPVVMDLWQRELNRPGDKLEISKVLAGGAWGINPVDFLPLRLPVTH